VGLDKHTEVGRKTLRQIAREENGPYRRLTWLNFYFESARSNETAPSRWWDREIAWRMKKLDLDAALTNE
jgi:hypothetical protein